MKERLSELKGLAAASSETRLAVERERLLRGEKPRSMFSNRQQSAAARLLAGFFVSILFFFRVLQVELQVQKSLADTGRMLAVYLSGEDGGFTAELTAANALFLKEMSGKKEAGRYIRGGTMGISLLESDFSEHEIRLRAIYQIRLPVRLFWTLDITVEQTACCRKWTGWHAAGEGGESDEWVYITEMGSVYHLSNDCTHLTLSIRSVDEGQVASLRNENGGKYRTCALCANRKHRGGRVYITNQGDRYHTDLNCSGIKRTVFLIRRSETGDRSCCTRCMGG